MFRSGWKPRVQTEGAKGWLFFGRPGDLVPPVRGDYDIGLTLGFAWTGCWLLLAGAALILGWTDVISTTAAVWLGWTGPLLMYVVITVLSGAARYWWDGPTRLLRMIGDGTVIAVRRNRLSEAVATAARADRPGYPEMVQTLQRIDLLTTLARTIPTLRRWWPTTGTAATGTAATGKAVTGKATGPLQQADLDFLHDRLRSAAVDEAELVGDRTREFSNVTPQVARQVVGSVIDAAEAEAEAEADADTDGDSDAAAGGRTRRSAKKRRRDGFSPRVYREVYDGPGTSVHPTWLVAVPDEVITERKNGRFAHPLRGGAIGVTVVMALGPIGMLPNQAWWYFLLIGGGFVLGWCWRKWITPLTSRTGRGLRAGRIVRLADTPVNREIARRAAAEAPFAWHLARRAAELDRLDAELGAGPPSSAAERVRRDERDFAARTLQLALSSTALQGALELLGPDDAAIAAAGTMTGQTFARLERIRSAILEANS